MPAKKTEEVTAKVTKPKTASTATKTKATPKTKEEAKPTAAPKAEATPQPKAIPTPQAQVAQPQTISNVLYDANGNPVFIQQGQTIQPKQVNPEVEEEKRKKKRKIGAFVSSLVTLILSFVFMGLAILFFYQFISGSDNSAGTVILFLVYMFTGIGFITFVPGFGLSIAALICSCFALKSSVKALKIISIFTTILSVIALVLAVVTPFLIPSIFTAATGSGSTGGAHM